jgi:ankyrin repeat protein
MTETPLRLPERPSLDQLRKQAKELQALEGLPTLASAQHTLARRYGYASWPKLKLAVESQILRRHIQARDATAVRQMLVASPKLAALPFADGSTPLHLASEMNSIELISELVHAIPRCRGPSRSERLRPRTSWSSLATSPIFSVPLAWDSPTKSGVFGMATRFVASPAKLAAPIGPTTENA